MVFVSLLAATKLDAVSYGTLGLVLVSATYLVHLNGGVLNAANREIPRLESDSGRGVRLQQVVVGWALLTFPLVAALGALLLASVGLRTWPLGLAALYVSAWYFFTTSQTILRATRQFSLLAGGLLAAAAAFVGGGGVAASAFGFTAILGALTAGLALPVARWALVFKAPVLPTKSEIARLIRIGAPMMGNGFGFVAAQTLNRWYVAWAAGVEGVAPIEIAHRFLSIPLFVAVVVLERFYPYLSAAVGRDDVKELKRLHRQQLLLVAVAVVTVAVALGAVGWLVRARLPDAYAAAVPALIAFAPGMLAWAVR